MTHGTTLPARGCHESPSLPRELLDTGHALGPPSVEVAGQCFRVQTPRFSTPWLPDTPSNRHLTVVWFRLLVDEHGRPVFILQE